MDFLLAFHGPKKLLIMTHVTPQTSTQTIWKKRLWVSWTPWMLLYLSSIRTQRASSYVRHEKRANIRDCWFSSCLFISWYLNSAVTNRNSLFLFSSSIWHNLYWKYYTIINTHSLWTISRKYHVDHARSGSYVPSFKTWGNEARSRSAVPLTVP